MSAPYEPEPKNHRPQCPAPPGRLGSRSGERRLKPPVLILCGGRGTRLKGASAELPKALVEVGGRPLLWHVASTYRAQGFERFIFLTGHLGDQVASYVESGELPEGGAYLALDTGEDTTTGGRVLLAREQLGDETFCLTYVDGLSDIDLEAELAFHRAHGKVGTVTLVRPRLQWGVARLDGDRVTGFVEKPTSSEWVNGGFLCFEAEVFDWLEAEESLESGPLERLANADQLRGYRHDGFWDCVDTYKDLVEVNDLWDRGDAAWLPAS